MSGAWDRHVGEEELELYAMGKLPEEDASLVEEHLLLCGPCQDRLEEADRFIEAFRSAAGQPAPEKQNWLQKVRGWVPAWTPRWSPAWAVGLVLLISVIIVPWQRMATGPAQEVTLESARGIEAPLAATAEAGRPVILKFAIQELPERATYRVELVNSAGNMLWEGETPRAEGQIALPLERGLPAGQYWVRVHEAGAGGELLREYGLQVKKEAGK